MNVLILEDEIRVLEFLTESLNSEGYEVFPCKSYSEALDTIEMLKDKLDLVIMDRLLDRMDAIGLIPLTKSTCPRSKILVLSTINNPTQKAALLDLGADDYLGKPFQLVELSARIRALTRRTLASPHNRFHQNINFQIKNLEVNVLDHKALINQKPIDLSNKEYLLLLTLLQHPGRVFNKYQLLDKIWNTQFDIESNVVEVTIKNLRRKLDESGSEVEILNRRNIGYWIEA